MARLDSLKASLKTIITRVILLRNRNKDFDSKGTLEHQEQTSQFVNHLFASDTQNEIKF